MLKISSTLKLATDFVTQTCAILARRGAGKSYTGSVVAEELIEAGLHVCIIDPIGVWWGLRSSADGKHEGLPVVIFGGDHGDLPLESTAGTLIADVVMEKKVSAVIDLSLMRKGEQDRFVCDFAERLYFKNRDPLHMIVDEADAFAPQKPQPGQQRMLGAMEDLVRRGRARGIGMTMVTQRSAVINKNLLSQIEVLICLQTTAPQDQAAILSWVEARGTDEECKIMMSSLASLQVGQAWVWSPAWAKVFKQVQIRERTTFDSSATPKIGTRRVEPKRLAPVEIESLKVQMAAVIEKKKADDPKELKKQIAALQAELKKAPAVKIVKEEVQIRPKIVEVPMLGKRDLALLEKMDKTVEQFSKDIARMLAEVTPPNTLARANISDVLTHASKMASQKLKPFIGEGPNKVKVTVRVPIPPSMTRGHGDEKCDSLAARSLDKIKRAILTVLAQYPEGRSKQQVAVIAGYAKGGHYNNNLCNLRVNGLIEGSGQLKITPLGLELLGDFDPLPTGEELAKHWYGQLESAPRKILEFLVGVYPQTATKEDIAAGVGMAVGGHFNNSLCRLRSLELAEGSRDIKASDNLF